jgi:hypothetical protein
VRDERSEPVYGAVVTAVGASTSVAVADRDGRFEFRTLPPGPYLIRAHLTGYVTPPAQVLQIRSTARTTLGLELKRAGYVVPVLAAGVGISDLAARSVVEPFPETVAQTPSDVASQPPSDPQAQPVEQGDSEQEVAWRIRHSRRAVLKEFTLGDLLSDGDLAPGTIGFTPVDLLGRAAGSSARIATSFFTDTPFSGQVNLLTTGSFDAPQQLFSPDLMPRGTANVSLSAPVGETADWTVRGAVTQADIASWIVAGSYTTRVPARHLYDLGMSYSMQRYDGGNPLALRSLTEGGRNAGEVYGFDTFAVTPALTVKYGTRYSRYDYLDSRSLVSPRVEVAVAPGDRFRISAIVSRTMNAPGAQEFLPPTDTGIWLPPQRTFSSLDPEQTLRAETTTHTAIEVQRDIARSTIGLRAFRQRVDDQFVTLFGAELPDQPVAKLGHYLVANAGNAVATGCTATFSTALSAWVRGSVEYSVTDARLTPSGDVRYLLLAAPSAVRPRTERIHDVATTVETRVPETATRVLVLYRLSNGFATPSSDGASSRPAVDSRFDVQVRQSLPFMDFSNARWEMLLAVRNFFHDSAVDQSVYDELLVVRPPKRIVGGLTMHF